MNKKQIRKNVAAAIVHLLRLTNGYVFFKPFYEGIGVILKFHRVVPADAGAYRLANKDLEVTPEYLDQCIKYFKSMSYSFLSLNEIYDRFTSKINSSGKFVSFTFDDGYKDNYKIAYKIFKKHDIPFTIYISTGFPDRKVILWWYVIEDILDKNNFLEFHVNGDTLYIKCETLREKKHAFSCVADIMLGLNEADRMKVLKEIVEIHHIDPFRKTDEMALTWEQIRQMSLDPLVTIGAHTVHHPVLSRLSEEEARGEIAHSKQILESRLGIRIEHFAYPYGGKGQAGLREFAMIAELGFKTATTTRSGTLFMEHRNHLGCLPRIGPFGGIEKIGDLPVMVSGALPAFQNRGKQMITD